MVLAACRASASMLRCSRMSAVVAVERDLGRVLMEVEAVCFWARLHCMAREAHYTEGIRVIGSVVWGAPGRVVVECP